MGRNRVGEPRGADAEGAARNAKPGWSRDNPGPSGQFERFVDGGRATRFKRKHALPSPGDRFGELTCLGHDGDRTITVRCSCGARPHTVDFYNLLRGASTRCPACAKESSGATRKLFFKYAKWIPDDEHRRRLLNRLSAAIGRCHRPRDPAFRNYGGRGISVFQEWREDRSKFCRFITTVPGWDNPSLEMDRIDVDGGYAPGNIRFVTKRENILNRRTVRDLQRRVADLEARLRHCTCGAPEQVHDCD